MLGRFNAAERMDNSRFWNWNESPIPLQAEDLTPETIQFQVPACHPLQTCHMRLHFSTWTCSMHAMHFALVEARIPSPA